MSWELVLVFVLIVCAVILFYTEWVPFDVTALIMAGVLMATGILSPSEGLSGFSNPATITIASMFVLSEGIRRTGALQWVDSFFTSLGKKDFNIAMLSMMGVIGGISAFINNTAAVALFIPVALGVAANLGVSPSKLLMPVSFASMFGGVCTLIGTSTNILVSSIMQKHGLPPFSMFEFAPLGLILAAAGLVYLFAVGIRLIPNRRASEDLTSAYEMNPFLTDVIVEPGFEHIGIPLNGEQLTQNLDLDVLRVLKPEEGHTESESAQRSQSALEAGDVLRIRGSAGEINKLLVREDLSLKPTREWYDIDLEKGRDTLVEAVVAPESNLERARIGEVNFWERFGGILLAVRHHGELQQEKLEEIRLSGGDSVLLAMEKGRVKEVQKDPLFVVVSEVSVEHYKGSKIPVAVAILGGVILAATLNWLPISVGALSGVILMVVTGCLTMEEVYRAINWKVIFLLAGVLPMGIAMDKTGAAGMISNGLIDSVGALGPTALVSGFFLVSMGLTNIISNQATAALLAPVAIQAASTMEISARPLVIAVTFAASLSFMSPVGYQTNTLIYGPGQYRFTDFTKVGTPLNIIFWILASIMIPLIWAF